jgi:hypothetical protein
MIGILIDRPLFSEPGFNNLKKLMYDGSQFSDLPAEREIQDNPSPAIIQLCSGSDCRIGLFSKIYRGNLCWRCEQKIESDYPIALNQSVSLEQSTKKKRKTNESEQNGRSKSAKKDV